MATFKKAVAAISFHMFSVKYIDGLVQYCSNSIANALELLQSYTKPSICAFKF